MIGLPVESVLPDLDRALERNGTAVLVAEPGAGKTTVVPLALRDAGWLQGKCILMLEPRRLAARAAAKRMADTLGEAVGGTVGYTVRLDRKVSKRTRIEVVTEGILTRRLQSDPELTDTGLLIFDEFHERGLDTDLGLALTFDIRKGLRPDLKILVMSATLDSERLSRHLGGAPVISAPGRVFPVTTRYSERATRKTVVAAMARAIAASLREALGSVLAFLPGEGEIRRTATLLSEMRLPTDVTVMPLYGAMPLAEQERAIRAMPAGIRKVVLATTIAETSLTIDGIDIVIDGGFKRVPRFDPATGMTRLDTVRVSQASADQRRGRAGRLGPGVCFRLWPEEETRALLPHDPPEILNADLAPLALELAAWGVSDPEALTWLDPPPAAAFAQARDLLTRLDALNAQGTITTMGRSMASLPLHPRLAHMVLRGKELGSGGLAADLAVLLSERDLLDRNAGTDLADRLDALRGGRDADRGAVERVRQASRQIRDIGRVEGSKNADVDAGVLVALAWPDRIAQARGGPGRFRFAGGGGGVLADHDPLARSRFLAVATTDGSPGDQKIFLAARLDIADIETHFASHIESREQVVWDNMSEAVIATARRMLGALMLDERPLAQPDREAVMRAILSGVRAIGLDALPWTDATRNLQARVAFLRRQFPETGWPDLSDAALEATLADWLGPWLAGMTRRTHLERLDLSAALMSLVPPALSSKLDVLAPSRIAIPSGATVRVDYADAADPTIRARLQEIFGLAETPRIADGRVKLRIELLSPAQRPLAVTQSLESFWTNAYPQIRAEMRGRYPKHSWPKDPINTTALAPRRIR
jgi:ATP-dependent helicase HrpB